MNTALVTGASRGIGRAIAITLAKEHKLHILINYVGNKEAAEETLREIELHNGTGELLQFNVALEETQSKIFAWIKTNPDKNLNVLINNAGVTKDNLFIWMKEEDWDQVINTSLKGMYNCTQAVIQDMIRKRSGKIINVASLSGLKGVPGQTNYSAAKGGMIAATKALAQEVAKRKITVNAVAPGFITSDMTKELDEDKFKKMVPLNRFGTSQEVADLVSFLVSNKSNYITGEVININGGLYS